MKGLIETCQVTHFVCVTATFCRACSVSRWSRPACLSLHSLSHPPPPRRFGFGVAMTASARPFDHSDMEPQKTFDSRSGLVARA